MINKDAKFNINIEATSHNSGIKFKLSQNNGGVPTEVIMAMLNSYLSRLQGIYQINFNNSLK